MPLEVGDSYDTLQPNAFLRPPPPSPPPMPPPPFTPAYRLLHTYNIVDQRLATLGALPNLADILPAGPLWEDPALMRAKARLNYVRDKLNILDTESLRTWGEHTRHLHLMEGVPARVRSGAQAELVTGAWLKLYELLHTFDDGLVQPLPLPDPESVVGLPVLRTAHVCEAPGAFVAATNHFVKTRMSEPVRLDWHGNSLHPERGERDPRATIGDDLGLMKHTEVWMAGGEA